MLKILNKFFDFCGSVNKKKFQISIVLGVIQAVCEAMKIPAIMIVLMDITDMRFPIMPDPAANAAITASTGSGANI